MRRSSVTSTLNGLFKAVYADKIKDLIPDSSLFNIDKSTYSLWQRQDQDYSVVVHPDTYKQLMEDSMGTMDCEAKCVEETPMQRALDSHKYQIKQLRESIARKQMELRIELARYTAVKKLAAKGAK